MRNPLMTLFFWLTLFGCSGTPSTMSPEQATQTAPQSYKVRFETEKGPFVVQVHRDWAPQGADRFYNLVNLGYYDGLYFFRAIKGFMVQYGIHGDPKVTAMWKDATFPDDPVKQQNTRGRITFATAGPNTRTTQVFINYGDNLRLDPMGFSPFGEVIEGMDVVDSLYQGYGEGAPRGRGPSQARLQSEGNPYLQADFPKMDKITKATLIID